MFDTPDALNTAYPVGEFEGENVPTFRTLMYANGTVPQMFGVQNEAKDRDMLFHSVIGQRCPRLVGLNAIKCRWGSKNETTVGHVSFMIAPAYQNDPFNTVVQ